MNLQISKQIIKYFIPVCFSFLFLATSTIVDGIFVANRFGDEAIAAMSIVQPFYLLAFAFSYSLQIGGQTYVGMELGKGDREQASRVLTSLTIKSLVTNTALAILIYLLSIPILNHLLTSVGTEVITYARQYLSMYLISLPIFGPVLMLNGCLKVDESPKAMSYIALAGTIGNIVFNYVLLFIFGVGIAGSALATIISNVIQLLLLIYFYAYKSKHLKFNFGLWSKQLYIKALINGSSDGMIDISIAIRSMLSNYVLLMTIGVAGIAAAGYINYIYLLIVIPIYALADTVSPFVSKAYGSKNFKLVNTYRKEGLKIATIVCVVMLVLVLSNLELVFSIFKISDQSLITYILKVTPIYYLSFIFAGYNQNQIAYLTAIDHGKTSLVASLLRNVVLITTMIVILSYCFGDIGLWTALLISEAMAAICIHFIVLKINCEEEIIPTHSG